MHVTRFLPHFAGLLLMAMTPLAGAETPLSDPVAPAVIGRPLDQIRPAPRVRHKAAGTAASRPKQVAAKSTAAPARSALAVPVAPAMAQTAPTAGSPATAQAPKQAVDDQVAANAHMANNVGKGTNLGRKGLAPGAYLGSKDQAVVRRYYEAHPVRNQGPTWKIGEPVAAGTKLQGVPDDVRAALPKVPPGHQYVQVDGDVVLVAVPSRMVVDGVTRSVR